ncbi:sigma 54-interacting transcriptional regulator [Chryseolinea sp. T2]|uniref:sigma 54-interacting transcriptional regulator n=1 Tax=Chryseolinea sp. T2 TaxID=3129255 RepID=UPI00307852DF
MELLSASQVKSADASFRMVLIFSDFVPTETEVPGIIWNLIEEGTRAILVLAESPRQAGLCWALMSRGLSDVVIWEGLEPLMRMIDANENRWRKITEILNSSVVKDNLVGASRIWNSFLVDVIEAAIYSQSNVLVYGESGTGKELVSRLIHTLDEREQKGKLVLLDCTTVVPELSGSEFFGHEKGSYTGSVTTRDGAFALADKGTLFLDEVSELPLTLQAELLRVIQEKSYKRVGSNTWKETDFRLVCATNKDLEKLVAKGEFRQDLYYRISGVQLSVPALRDHSADIELLATHFLTQFFEERNIREVPRFDDAVIDFIVHKEYVGNIRELRQFIRRTAMRHAGGAYISLGSIPVTERPASDRVNDFGNVIDGWEDSIKRAIISGESLMDIKNIAAYLAIKVAIDLEQGDKQKAAQRLSVTVRAVQQHLKRNFAVHE